MTSKLYIAYCIDTEGPLHESLNATFQRLNDIFGVELEATKENLSRLQNQEIDLVYDMVDEIVIDLLK